MVFPDLDCWGRPMVKLPNCPRCDADELGVIHENLVMCYACNWKLFKDEQPVDNKKEYYQ